MTPAIELKLLMCVAPGMPLCVLRVGMATSRLPDLVFDLGRRGEHGPPASADLVLTSAAAAPAAISGAAANTVASSPT
jgi:hypothetical protein